MNQKIEDFLNAVKLGELMHKNEAKEEKKNTFLCILAAVGVIAAIAGIAYAVYKYFYNDYLEDFDDDFEDYEDDYDDEDENHTCCCKHVDEE